MKLFRDVLEAEPEAWTLITTDTGKPLASRPEPVAALNPGGHEVTPANLASMVSLTASTSRAPLIAMGISAVILLGIAALSVGLGEPRASSAPMAAPAVELQHPAAASAAPAVEPPPAAAPDLAIAEEPAPPRKPRCRAKPSPPEEARPKAPKSQPVAREDRRAYAAGGHRRQGSPEEERDPHMVKLLLTVLLAAYLPSSAFAANPPGKEDFDAATRLFNAEEYEAALPYFERAYTLSGRRPATVLALAQCLRALKRYEDAIARFEEYRPSATDNAKEIDETLALLTDLKKRQTEKAREEAEERAKSEERARQATAAACAR